MPDYAPPGAAGDLAVEPGTTLTAEAIEGILQDFRAWLQQAAVAEQPAPAEPEFSWHALAAEFTALRHEVNLQTKAARAQSEQNAAALEKLDEAIGAVSEARGDDGGDEALRPLLKTLVDVYDSLALARREVQRVQSKIEDLQAHAEEGEGLIPVQSPATSPVRVRPWREWWLALTGRAQPSQPRSAAELEHRMAQQEKELTDLRQADSTRAQTAAQIRQVFSSIIVGYTMSLQRIERAIAQHGLEPIDCVGEQFDPECMEVVEVVTEPGRQGTEVLEEVRRGYRWRGRLFRFAQVRVSRP
ncbi:MAG TPA: nucleotide exchange factor GrpE [Gemmataceae bacterium]|nr:nucleotide exchange factor GrpE [Gemmataceae bacterium]